LKARPIWTSIHPIGGDTADDRRQGLIMRGQGGPFARPWPATPHFESIAQKQMAPIRQALLADRSKLG
jgi:hypothetical protein